MARLISVSGESDATISASAGAVPPNSDVICITMETGHYTIVRAASDGSFSASLFAPPGASILIKPDTTQRLLTEVLTRPPLVDFHFNELISLPGTIVRRDDPPGEAGTIGFGSAQLLIRDGMYAAVTVRGSMNRVTFGLGDTLHIRMNVTARPVALTGAAPRFRVQLSLTPLSGPDGSPRLAQNTFCSTVMTPTALPIERSQWLYTGYQGQAESTPTLTGSEASAELQASLTFGNDLPAGYYRPSIHLTLDATPSRPLEGERIITVIDSTGRGASSMYLPIVRIGEPAEPRLPVSLLMNDAVEAMRGATALEDRGRFAIAPHIITASERMVVPRLDRRSGAVVRYLLEPYAPTVAIGDRGAPPAPPLIPFRYPSGSLRLTVRAPDGAVTTIGPVEIRQPLLFGPSKDGYSMEGGGYITDALLLTTLDPRFQVPFSRDGVHRIEIDARIDDVWGNRWRAGGTYEVDVAQPLLLETSPLPGTPFEVGDALSFRAAVKPPVAADVDVTLRFAPRSRTVPIEWRASGRANRFGHFVLPSFFRFDDPGEYRIDVLASFVDASGARRSSAMTWGGVVGPRDARIVAHGRRGIDDQPENRQAWFLRTQTGLTFGRGHVEIPFHSGDVMWMEDGDAAVPNISYQDLLGTLPALVNRYCCGPRGDDAAGDTRLFSANFQNLDVHLSPAVPDLIGYSYRAVERPLVRVREIVGEDQVMAPYWRFNDLYGRQSGTGGHGDLPNDFKFQFAGTVLRGNAVGEPFYAIYASLFVLVQENDAGGGTRVFPPFQGNGGGPSGGPLFTLKGKEIDIFFHPTAIRPGTILHVGETVSLAGYMAPTLPSKIEIVVTSPSGVARTMAGQANRVGYFYEPSFDFPLTEPGAWKVNLRVFHDGVLPSTSGRVQPPYPTGDVLGSRNGEFYFYAVERASEPLRLAAMPQFVRPADGPITFTVIPPEGLTNVQLAYTTAMPGFLLEEGTTDTLRYTYDARALARHFPNLDLHDAGDAGVDIITVSFLLSGTDTTGARRHLARQLVISGEELQMPEQNRELPQPKRRAVRR